MVNANSKPRHEILALGSTRERHLSPVFQHQGATERMKRVGDVVIACVILAITLPLIVIVALAIKCESPGPVLDRQPCIGSRGRRFQMLQFRTSEHDPAQSTPAWAQKMTQVGRLLRTPASRVSRSSSMCFVVRWASSMVMGIHPRSWRKPGSRRLHLRVSSSGNAVRPLFDPERLSTRAGLCG